MPHARQRHDDERRSGSVRGRGTAPVVVVAAVVALAGCGSGADGAAYARTYETNCRQLATAVARFQDTVARAVQKAPKSKPESAFPAVKLGTTALYAALGDSFAALADADAPSEYSDFQASVAQGAAARRDAFESARSAAQRARTLKDITALTASAQDSDLTTSEPIPKALAKKAPSCASFGSPAA